MSGSGDRTLLAVFDGSTVRFWADTETIAKRLANTPVRLDAFGSECLLQPGGEWIEVAFKREYEPVLVCRFPRRNLEEGLLELRRCVARSEHLF